MLSQPHVRSIKLITAGSTNKDLKCCRVAVFEEAWASWGSSWSGDIFVTVRPRRCQTKSKPDDLQMIQCFFPLQLCLIYLCCDPIVCSKGQLNSATKRTQNMCFIKSPTISAVLLRTTSMSEMSYTLVLIYLTQSQLTISV